MKERKLTTTNVVSMETGKTGNRWISIQKLRNQANKASIYIMALSLFSCNLSKNDGPKAEAQLYKERESCSQHDKDSLYIEIKKNVFQKEDTITISYSICNTTKWHYKYP